MGLGCPWLARGWVELVLHCLGPGTVEEESYHRNGAECLDELGSTRHV